MITTKFQFIEKMHLNRSGKLDRKALESINVVFDSVEIKEEPITDTEKAKTGIERPEFFYLAPNSITKVRVYVYLEGQDVDNYDFASLGTSIFAQFGFTKERFNGDEILPAEGN
jgi:hypothetical protein